MKRVGCIFDNAFGLIIGAGILFGGLCMINNHGQIALWLWDFLKNVFAINAFEFYRFVQSANGFVQIIGWIVIVLGGIALLEEVLDLIKNICFFEKDA